MKPKLNSPPFRLPVRIVDEHFLVADDCELITKLPDATDAEKAYIVKALNAMPALLKAAHVLEELVGMAWAFPSEDQEQDPVVVEAREALADVKALSC